MAAIISFPKAQPSAWASSVRPATARVFRSSLGKLIDANITIVDGVKHYDFSQVAIFWIAAAVISFLLPLLNIRHKRNQ